MKNHSAVCYILKNNGKDEDGNIIRIFEAVQSAKTFKNSYGLDLFEIDGDITEGRCGIKVCSANKFEEAIKNYGIEKLESMVQSAIEKYGLSPRYTKPEETKKEVFNIPDKDTEEHAKLMKPLFIDGMFNREGKRIRAKYVKTLSFNGIDYPLWISAGKPDKDYGKNEDDKYYYMIETNGFLVPCGLTQHELKQRSDYDYLIKVFYNGRENKDNIFQEIYKGRTYQEYKPLVEEQTEKENAFIAEHCNNESIQAEYLKLNIDRCIEQYIDARDNNGRFADFHGAVFLNELDKCIEISNRNKAIREQEDKIKRAEREAKQRAEEEEKEKAEQETIRQTENTFINGGTITDGYIIVKIADKHGVNIPIRTRGWILNTLAECTISDSGSVSYRYYKSKNGTGSQKVYDILFDIRKAISTRVIDKTA